MKRAVKRLVRGFGYELQKCDPNLGSRSGFQLYQYTNPDGTFDYGSYRAVQQEGNLKKLDRSFVSEKNVVFLAGYLRERLNPLEFGICHGTRRGNEQRWFRENLDAQVIGTEISDTAHQFPHTIQWDFHNVKDEWRDSVDFIYSNSLDHSYDPEACLNAWMSCVRLGGFCVLEHTSLHERATRLDPFGVDLPMLLYLVLKWGGSRYGVRALLEAPEVPTDATQGCFIVIQRFE